jgi:hypothetical protein
MQDQRKDPDRKSDTANKTARHQAQLPECFHFRELKKEGR